jgi:DNA protecting protein DprA
VGTRDSTPTGEKVAFQIAKWLVEERWSVVSGLAKGIDAAAHRGALSKRGRTVAVMATPLDKVYPAENKQLAYEILDHDGCWVSEIPLGKSAHRGAFVRRDRIQSGMCVAVVPVQTDVEGGTMHTVGFAEKQGRLLLCPQPTEKERFLKQYAGVRCLIETGRAKAFSSEEFGHVLLMLLEHRDSLLSSWHEREREPSSRDESSFSHPNLIGSRRNELQTGDRIQKGFEFQFDEKEQVDTVLDKIKREAQLELIEELLRELSNGSSPNDIVIRRWAETKLRSFREGTTSITPDSVKDSRH